MFELATGKKVFELNFKARSISCRAKQEYFTHCVVREMLSTITRRESSLRNVIIFYEL